MNDNKIWNLCKDRVQYADQVHPEGPSFTALVSEVAETMEAFDAMMGKNGSVEDYESELLDVIAVAFRLLRVWRSDK